MTALTISDINIIYQVVIPIACGAAGCIITIAVALLVWRRSKEKRKTTKTNTRLNAGMLLRIDNCDQRRVY